MSILIFAIGILCGLAIGAILDRVTAKAPARTQHLGKSAFGFDLHGNGGAEGDPRYQKMLNSVLEQPAPEGGSGFRTLLR
jgi:hypothetical protein